MAAVLAQRSPLARQSLGPVQWRIAGLAVLIHVAFVMIPIAKKNGSPGRPLLEIELRQSSKPVPEETGPAREAPRPEVPPPSAEPATSESATPPLSDETRVQAEQNIDPDISAALLLEQASQGVMPYLPATTAQLGRIAPRAPASLRSGPVLPPVTTVFEDFYLPRETEIMDQWQAPDGTRHVVLRTATGHTLCGQQQAWDPFNPLFEPIPMYRLCAGGGKRRR